MTFFLMPHYGYIVYSELIKPIVIVTTIYCVDCLAHGSPLNAHWSVKFDLRKSLVDKWRFHIIKS